MEFRTFTINDFYNLEDINRIELNCSYLINWLDGCGYAHLDLVTKEWNINDIPTIEEMERIRSNVYLIREQIDKYFDIPPFYNYFDYTNANSLENALKYTYEVLEQIVEQCINPLANLYYANEPLWLPTERN